jgi:hypothetical protein
MQRNEIDGNCFGLKQHRRLYSGASGNYAGLEVRSLWAAIAGPVAKARQAQGTNMQPWNSFEYSGWISYYCLPWIGAASFLNVANSISVPPFMCLISRTARLGSLIGTIEIAGNCRQTRPHRFVRPRFAEPVAALGATSMEALTMDPNGADDPRGKDPNAAGRKLFGCQSR